MFLSISLCVQALHLSALLDLVVKDVCNVGELQKHLLWLSSL